jgi:CheY-like chemotaxis protein
MDAGTVLIVDDDEDIREVIRLVLETYGHRVASAVDGLDALELLQREGAPALILLDMMMPRLDGEGFVKILRATPALAHVPIILLSGHSAAREKAQALAADGCLVKPIELEDLIAVVRRFSQEPLSPPR